MCANTHLLFFLFFNVYTDNSKVGSDNTWTDIYTSLDIRKGGCITGIYTHVRYGFVIQRRDHKYTRVHGATGYETYTPEHTISIFLPPFRMPPFLSCTELPPPITTTVLISSSTVSQNRGLIRQNKHKSHECIQNKKVKFKCKFKCKRMEGREKHRDNLDTIYNINSKGDTNANRKHHKMENKRKLSLQTKKPHQIQTKCKNVEVLKATMCTKRGFNHICKGSLECNSMDESC